MPVGWQVAIYSILGSLMANMESPYCYRPTNDLASDAELQKISVRNKR